ncbi:Wadjet anti-phage system protein JetD domain-containing protein [Janthinobacterium sp. Mn2066]|uniref:Wadjet anti-phage system protein JetD domain-containing protein n=1 Tax=Janthinobacterium sp. Mn2066 TaxID=3395264 RepID=UPI003BE94DA3
MNGLVFLGALNGMMIFRAAYGIGHLADIDWLPGKKISYWGYRSHGFVMLGRLRTFLPHLHHPDGLKGAGRMSWF